MPKINHPSLLAMEPDEIEIIANKIEDIAIRKDHPRLFYHPKLRALLAYSDANFYTILKKDKNGFTPNLDHTQEEYWEKFINKEHDTMSYESKEDGLTDLSKHCEFVLVMRKYPDRYEFKGLIFKDGLFVEDPQLATPFTHAPIYVGESDQHVKGVIEKTIPTSTILEHV